MLSIVPHSRVNATAPSLPVLIVETNSPLLKSWTFTWCKISVFLIFFYDSFDFLFAILGMANKLSWECKIELKNNKFH